MEIIAQYGTVFLILAIVFGLYMTWGIGANDVANAMGTSVGSGGITVKQAIIIAAIFEFAGAFIAGGNVTKTIRKGIINPDMIAGSPELLVYGMLAALLAAAIWLMLASWNGWPVSTTHSIIGGLVGFAVVGIAVESVNWGKISQIVASWLVSPLLGGFFGFLLMVSVQRLILRTRDPVTQAKKWGPFYVFLVGWIVCLVTMFKGLKHLHLDLSPAESLIGATIVGIIIALVGRAMINKVQVEESADRDVQFAMVEKIFVPMMVFTACAMAFAHGSNDVANGIGPLAAVISLVQSGGEVTQSAAMPLWVLVLGGVGIIVGLATLGYRVMRTIGTRITQLTPSRGYCATLAAATTVVLASKTGLPVSTTHIAVGAVMGVGMTRGLGALNLRVIRDIVISWVITVPAGGILAMFFFFTLKGIFGTGA
ncbi:MAG: inorganic phosphate transporter [Pseudomonadota bacterium]|nr:inorganic phosphate transporter [Pseudomonadota bacterium]